MNGIGLVMVGAQYDDGRQAWRPLQRAILPPGRAERFFVAGDGRWYDVTSGLLPHGGYYVLDGISEISINERPTAWAAPGELKRLADAIGTP